jgi:signal transduction histidine kinase
MYWEQTWEKRADLGQAQRAQTESMLMLVHELRSPAAACKSMAIMLRHLDLEHTQRDQFLSRIEHRMDQLLQLVNDILDLSQAKAGRPLEHRVDLDLVTQTRTVCEPYLDDARVKGLAMTLDLPDSPVRVHMAERAYHLILSNLVSNAVKYTHSGAVCITLRKKTPWATLEIQDSGIGIPQGEVGQLFTEFFRASNTRHSDIPGTGLGLAGVKALVERFEGVLQVASEEQVGSRFTVHLPLYN